MPPAKTIFEKLMSGEVPAHVIYEDDEVFAFLDIEPLSRGHVLVVPRRPVQTLGELTEQEGAALGRILPRLCRAVCKVTGAREYNVLQNNGPMAHQAVPHVHFHIIPRPNEAEGLSVAWRSKRLDSEIGRALARELGDALGPKRSGAQRAEPQA